MRIVFYRTSGRAALQTKHERELFVRITTKECESHSSRRERCVRFGPLAQSELSKFCGEDARAQLSSSGFALCCSRDSYLLWQPVRALANRVSGVLPTESPGPTALTECAASVTFASAAFAAQIAPEDKKDSRDGKRSRPHLLLCCVFPVTQARKRPLVVTIIDGHGKVYILFCAD